MTSPPSSVAAFATLEPASGFERPRVGIGVLVWQAGKVLLGRRLGAHGAHSWSFPGGHLEFGETFAACGAREVREETGLVVECRGVVGVSNDVFTGEGRHYVTVFVQAFSNSAEARRLEPEKCAEWAWFEWSALPSPLFLPIQNLLAGGFVPSPLHA